MLAQVLALHLALLDPATAPGVHVLPPLELSGPGPGLAQAEGPPSSPGEPAPAERAAPARRGNVLAGYGGGLVGTLASDLVFVGLVALGFANTYGGFLDDGNPSGAWAVLVLAGATGFVFVTPAATVWAAQKAEGFERPGLAYAAVFGVRLLGFLAAQAAPAILLVTELVAAPLVAAIVAASGTPIGRRASPPPDFPDEQPRPGAGPGGPPLSRPLCPDAAFALR
jgi:hypothetical protein